MPAAIETQNLTRRFGSVTALDGVTLSIAEGEFFSLLGPSGCGKTTLLRLIAGLDQPDGGSLRLNGADALDVPAHRRPVNTVFQSYALFPHMTVADNISFGLKMKQVSAAETRSRVGRAMEMVDIAALGERKPAQLSGGQKQRVALARAIVNEPKMLLLDEPLGALDLKLRKQLQDELRRLHKRLGITFVYVTHDQEEALSMSDRIAVMNHGGVVQLGAPDEIYANPRTRFVAEFLGSCNVVAGTVRSRDGDRLAIDTLFGLVTMNVPGWEGGSDMALTVRPEHLRLSPRAGAGVAATVIGVVYHGAQTHYDVEVAGVVLKIFVLNSHEAERLQMGQAVALDLLPGGLRLLRDE